VVLSNVDRELLQKCLENRAEAWEDFVDRFAGLVLHVVRHTAKCRSFPLSQSVQDDLTSEIFALLIKDNMAVLRRFRGRSSLATYLTVVARRVVVRGLHQLRTRNRASQDAWMAELAADPKAVVPGQPIESVEEIEHALTRLEGPEAQAVRMFHLEGKSYREIGQHMGMPENTVGPLLSRARDKMRRALE
jgi:RNA polymerase sigma-70 factor (ECF subfamily)